MPHTSLGHIQVPHAPCASHAPHAPRHPSSQLRPRLMPGHHGPWESGMQEKPGARHWVHISGASSQLQCRQPWLLSRREQGCSRSRPALTPALVPRYRMLRGLLGHFVRHRGSGTAGPQQGQSAGEGAPKAPQWRVGDSREPLGRRPWARTWPWPCARLGWHMGCNKLPSPPSHGGCPLLHSWVTERKDEAGLVGSHLIFSRSKAQAEGSGVGMKPEGGSNLCQGLPGVIRGLDVAGTHLGGRWEAGAAQLPFPVPRSIIYLQQNAGRHLAGESIPLAEKQVSGGTAGGARGWILQFSRYYLAAINRASHTAGER